MKRGRIVGLQIFREKGQPGVVVDTAEVIAGKGLDGDRHADGGAKQISLLDADVRAFINQCETPGLCFARYKENLLVDGGLIPGLQAGDCLEINEAVLRITGRNKRCFPQCERFREGKECPLARGNAWAEAVTGGRICKENIIILKRE